MMGLLERSLSAAAVIVILILIRKLLIHKLPKFTFHLAWGVVVLRLLCPYSVPVFSADAPAKIPGFMDFFAGDSQGADAGKTAADEGYLLPDGDGSGSSIRAGIADSSVRESFHGKNSQPTGGDSLTAGSNRGSMPQSNAGGDIHQNIPQNFGKSDDLRTDGEETAALNRTAATVRILRILWLAGVLFLLSYFLVSHLRARKLYATALPLNHSLPEIDFYPGLGHGGRGAGKFRRKVTIKVSDRIFAPVTYGLFSHVILLPKTTDWENTVQLRMVLAHEAVHIRRFDILYKWLLAAAVALHWFNPFVWAMYFLANRDIELSCDETVVRSLRKDGKKDYALALLNYEEKRMFSPTVSGFGGTAVREMIEAIMKINKTSIASMAMAAILVAGTTTVFAGAKENKTVPENGQEKILGGNPSAAGGNSGEKKPDSQAPQEENRKNENTDAQDSDKKSPSEKAEDGSTPVKQYLCEPAYYTLEEFEEIMEVERAEIASMLQNGAITKKYADEILEKIEKDIDEVRNGKKCEKPSQVFYADGTPVVNSQGGYLYVKASDIEQMNAWLRAKAAGVDDYGQQEADNISAAQDGTLFAGAVLEDIIGNFTASEMDSSWYTYAEYMEYIEKQKNDYRSMKGEWGFNSSDGWFEWDDEKIEEACKLLDENLDFIKNGGMISMPTEDGGNLIGQMMMMSSSEFLGNAEEARWVMSTDEIEADGYIVSQAEKITQEGGKFNQGLLKDYEAFGVTADEKAGNYLYQGKKIAGLRDGDFLMMDGSAEEDGVYLKGVREDGKLVGLEKITKEEFQKLAMRKAK